MLGSLTMSKERNEMDLITRSQQILKEYIPNFNNLPEYRQLLMIVELAQGLARLNTLYNRDESISKAKRNK